MKYLALALAAISVWTAEAALTLLAPKEGETVPQLWQNVKDFLDLPREARKENAYKISKKEKDQFKKSRGAKPVEFAWTGETIPEKLERYFLSLGYTKEQIEFVREFLLEPAQ